MKKFDYIFIKQPDFSIDAKKIYDKYQNNEKAFINLYYYFSYQKK
jgi:hypothetical protein